MDTPSVRSRVLFIVPLMPGPGGNGLAMRAAALLDALSRQADVTLYVVPVSGGSLLVSDHVAARTRRVGVLDLAAGQEAQAGLIERLVDPAERQRHRLAYPRPWDCRFSGAAALRLMAAWLGDAAFDAVLAMRLYLAPLALGYLRDARPKVPLALLDLDEDDAQAQAQLASLHERQHETAAAALARAESEKYARLGQALLPSFHIAFTCAAAETRRLAARHPGTRFATVPNSYPLTPAPIRVRPPGDTLRLLMVGNFGYLPNRDAARHLVTDILPLLRGHGISVAVDIVGAGGTAAMLGEHAGISVQDAVPALDGYYDRADIAVVPLRAGAGTRIKILEAFAHHVPVVSTSIGAAGLAVAHATHLLLADDPRAFALACLQLARSPELRAHLAAEAAAFLRENHTSACVEAALQAILGTPTSPRPLRRATR